MRAHVKVSLWALSNRQKSKAELKHRLSASIYRNVRAAVCRRISPIYPRAYLRFFLRDGFHAGPHGDTARLGRIFSVSSARHTFEIRAVFVFEVGPAMRCARPCSARVRARVRVMGMGEKVSVCVLFVLVDNRCICVCVGSDIFGYRFDCRV